MYTPLTTASGGPLIEFRHQVLSPVEWSRGKNFNRGELQPIISILIFPPPTLPHSFRTPGNRYRLHKRKGDQRADFDPRGGRLPNVPAVAEQPSSPSTRGLGVAYVVFRVRPGTVGGIASFYREVFGAEVEEIGGGGGVGGGDGDCAAEGGCGSGEMSCSATVRG